MVSKQIQIVILSLLFMPACFTMGIETREQLSEEFSVIEGHLASKPFRARKNKRLILYIGDIKIEQEAPKILETIEGDEIVIEPRETPQPKLTNIRKAVTENDEEEWVLDNLETLLNANYKIGPEGRTVRLFGKFVKDKRHMEHVGGFDFFFCFIGYDDPITGEDTPIDTCYGNRWKDDILEFMKSGGPGALQKAGKAVLP